MPKGYDEISPDDIVTAKGYDEIDPSDVVSAPTPHKRIFQEPAAVSTMGIASPNDKKAAEAAKTFVYEDVPNVATTGGARVGAAFQQSVGGLLRAAGEFRRVRPGESVDPFMTDAEQEATAAVEDGGNPTLIAKGTQLGDEARAIQAVIDQEKPLKTRAGKILGSTVESVGANIPGMAATMVTANPAVGLSMMGLQQFGQTYDESRAKGLSVEDATTNAAIQGGTEVATELLPFVKLSEFMKPGKLGKKVLEHYLADVPGEHVATAVENATGKYFDRPDMTPEQRKQAAINYFVSNEHGQDQIDTFFTTILQSAVMGGMAKVSHTGAVAVTNPRMTLDAARQRLQAVRNELRQPADLHVEVPDTGIMNDTVSVDDAIAAANSEVDKGSTGWDKASRDELLRKLTGETATEPGARGHLDTVDTREALADPLLRQIESLDFTGSPFQEYNLNDPTQVSERVAASRPQLATVDGAPLRLSFDDYLRTPEGAQEFMQRTKGTKQSNKPDSARQTVLRNWRAEYEAAGWQVPAAAPSIIGVEGYRRKDVLPNRPILTPEQEAVQDAFLTERPVSRDALDEVLANQADSTLAGEMAAGREAAQQQRQQNQLQSGPVETAPSPAVVAGTPPAQPLPAQAGDLSTGKSTGVENLSPMAARAKGMEAYKATQKLQQQIARHVGEKVAQEIADRIDTQLADEDGPARSELAGPGGRGHVFYGEMQKELQKALDGVEAQAKQPGSFIAKQQEQRRADDERRLLDTMDQWDRKEANELADLLEQKNLTPQHLAAIQDALDSGDRERVLQTMHDVAQEAKDKLKLVPPAAQIETGMSKGMQEFIRSRVQKLGSIEAVRQTYDDETAEADRYARQYAEQLYRQEPAETKASAADTPTVKKSLQVDRQNDDIAVAISKLGGINYDEALKEWGAMVKDGRKALAAHVHRQTRRFGHVFKSAGLSLDKMRETLVGHGYLPEGASINDLHEAIERATRGDFAASTEKNLDADIEREAREYEERMMDALNDESLLDEAGAHDLTEEESHAFRLLMQAEIDAVTAEVYAQDGIADLSASEVQAAIDEAQEHFWREINESSDAGEAARENGSAGGSEESQPAIEGAGGSRSAESNAAGQGKGEGLPSIDEFERMLDEAAQPKAPRYEKTAAGDQGVLIQGSREFGKGRNPKNKGQAGLEDMALFTEPRERAAENAQGSLLPDAPKSMQEHIAAAIDAGADAIHELLKGVGNPTTLGSGPVFDDETYQKMRPHLSRMWSEIKAAGFSAAEAAQSFAKQLVEKFGVKIKPFALKYYQELLDQERGGNDGSKADAGSAGREGESATAGAPREGTDASGERTAEDVAGKRPEEVQGSGAAGQGDTASGAAGPAPGESGRPAGGSTAPRPVRNLEDVRRPDHVTGSARNFTITNELDFSGVGAKGKFRNNVAAIRTLQTLEKEMRPATPDEQAVLARYVGWGGLPQAFDAKNKDWAKEYAELKDLLTPEQYDTAVSSTQNAHYTAAEVVKGIWSAVRRLGFDRGTVLEPSMGTGNFFGLMPRELRSLSRLTGVEFDHITGMIAKHLYPKARVHSPMGFEQLQIIPGSFDLAIGNPPFGSKSVHDPTNKTLSRFKIHGYFFAKSVDSLRPGGVLAMVVSKGFMDANDATGKAQRDYVADRARLLGAIRLPDNAFSKNAGTDVTTDIVFLQKLAPGEQGNSSEWNTMEAVRDPETGADIPINKYFAARPEMMLGDMTLRGKMYRGGTETLTARPGENLGEALQAAIEKLPEGVMQPAVKGSAELNAGAVSGLAAANEVRPYNYFLEDGKLYQRMPDLNGETQSELVDVKGTTAERIAGMIGLRDAVRKQLALEGSRSSSDMAIEHNRKVLNGLYDAFVKKYGQLNNDTNKRLFWDDADAPLVRSLEVGFDKGISKEVAKKQGKEAREPSAKKNDILSKRVASPPMEVTKADSASDALSASMNEKGRVDLPYMASIYGKGEEEILRELGDAVYEDPSTGWVPASEYLSGNVKAKLTEALNAATEDPRYARNVEALDAVQPADIPAADIFVAPHSFWVPEEVYHQFAAEVLKGTMRGGYSRSTHGWNVVFSSGDNTLNNVKLGTARVSATQIMATLMANRQIAVYDRGPNDERVLNAGETAAAQGKADELVELFQDWIWKNSERRQAVVRKYNDLMNTTVEAKHDGSHMTFPGMSLQWQQWFRPHQKNAVFRSVQSGVALYDHTVGAGKTAVIAATAMELRRLGLAKKPMITVPNHLVDQWAEAIKQIYPQAKVLAATKKDFEKNNRRQLFAKIATGDWDAVVVAHSSFKFIPVPPSTQMEILEEQKAEIMQAILEAKADAGKKLSVKKLEEMRDRISNKIQALAEMPKDDLLNFEEMGVDALFVDEAHEFKNLFYTTTMQNVAGLGDPTGSGRAFDMFIKTQYLMRRNGGKGVYFATGTPVSNSLAEVFHMQRFLQYDDLKARGLANFDAWASAFGQATTDWEQDAGGRYKQKTRFRKLVNLPELKQLWRSVADTIVNADLIRDAEAQGKRFPLPKVEGGKPKNVVVDRSQQQADYIGVPFEKLDEEVQPVINTETGLPVMEYLPGTIVYRMEHWLEEKKKGNTREMPLVITGDARKAGLDFRLIDENAPDFAGSKVNTAVNEIHSIWKENDHRKGTQLVFIDLSTPKSAKGQSTAQMAAQVPTYFTMDGGSLAHVAGKPVKLDIMPDREFFSFKRGKTVRVYDRLTGLWMGEGANVTEAKEDATQAIQRAGVDATEQRMRQRAIPDEEIDRYVTTWEAEQADKEEDTSQEETKGPEISFDDLLADSGKSNFSVYDDMKAKLIAKGVPADQIAFIHDANTDAQKADLFGKVNNGVVRILLGSTMKMGAGTNVQQRLVALHHLDAPWKPSDLEQREGRIIRQGNLFYNEDPTGFMVKIRRYATKQTYDSRMWEIIETKAKSIELFKTGGQDLREVEDVSSESANAAEIKASAAGNPLMLEDLQMKQEIKKLEGMEKSWKRSRYDMEDLVASVEKRSAFPYKRLAAMEKAESALQRKNADKLGLQLGKVTYDTVKDFKPEEMFSVISRAYTTSLRDMKPIEVGSYRGADIQVSASHVGKSVRVELYANGERIGVTDYTLEDKFSAPGLITRLDNIVDGVGMEKSKTQDNIARLERDAESSREQLKEPFKYADKLRELRERHKAVIAALRAGRSSLEGEAPAAAASSFAPAGWGSVDTGSDVFNQEAAKKVGDIIAKALPGDKVDVQIVAGAITPPEDAAAAWAKHGKTDGTIGAMHTKTVSLTTGEVRSLITLSLSNSTERTGYHEVMHAAENLGVLSEKDVAILERAYPEKDGVAASERRADAFADYLMEQKRPQGYPKLLFDRIKNFLRRLGNALKLRGWRTADDVFRELAGGKLKREAQGRANAEGAVEFAPAWDVPQQRVSSASTSISYPDPEKKAPIIFSAFREGKIQLGPLNADIGGGRFDQITSWLKGKGVENVVWDRFNRDKAHNDAAQAKVQGGQADTATVSNVLNVIPDAENRVTVIATAYDTLKPGGRAFFSMYAAPQAGDVKGRDAYQTGMKVADYIPEIEEVFGKGSVTRKGDILVATKGAVQASSQFSPAQGPPDLPQETRVQKGWRKFQDRYNRVGILQDWLKEQGVHLSDLANASRGLATMNGKVADQLSRFMDNTIQPLVKDAAKSKISLDDVSDYLLMQHAVEANEQMRKLHDKPDALAYGITDDEAQQALADYQARPDFADLKRIADQFQALSGQTADMLEDNGIISPEMRAAWDNAYQHYVPVRGGDEDTGQGTGKGLRVAGKQQRRSGHSRRNEHVIENIIKARERAIKAVEKNNVSLSVAQLIMEAADDRIGTLGRPEKRRVFRSQRNYTVLYQGNPVASFHSEAEADKWVDRDRAGTGRPITDYVVNISTDPTVSWATNPMLGENEINAYINGHQLRIQINDEIAARALTHMGVEHLNSLLSVGKQINNYLSRAYTGYDPRFTIRNTFRDFTAGMVNLTGDYGAATATKIALNYPKAVREFMKARHDPTRSSWVDRYRKHGGSTGASWLSSIERIGEDVQHIYQEQIGAMATYRSVFDEEKAKGRSDMAARARALARSGVAGFHKVPVLGHFLKMIETMNAVSENAFRVATFMTLVQEGRSEEEAGEAAKNSTINFDKKGELGPQMGALWLFFNPAMQGIHRTVFALTQSKHKRQAQAIVGSMALVGFMAAELARNMGGGDDDEEWEKIPRFVKNRNLVIRTGEKTQITIPLPYEYASFVGIGYALNDMVHGKADRRTALNLASSLIDGFAPLGNPVSDDGEVEPLVMMPTVAKMALAPTTNTNSFGNKIAPDKFVESKPDSQKMWRDTKGSVYDRIASGLNEATGGTKFSSGAVDVSPEVLKYYTRTLLGGAATFVDQVIGLGIVAANGAEPDLQELPMVSVLARENSVRDTRRMFWEIAGDATTAIDQFKEARKAHDYGAAKKIREENAEVLKLAKLAEHQAKLAKAKRDAIDAIRVDEKLDFAEKRERTKALEEKEAQIYDRLIKTFNR